MATFIFSETLAARNYRELIFFAARVSGKRKVAKWFFCASLWRNLDSSQPIVCVSTEAEEARRGMIFVEYMCPRSEEELLLKARINWKQHFFNIREIVVVTRKEKVEGNDEKIKFEVNFLINSKKMKKFEFFFVKGSPPARRLDDMSWNITLWSKCGEDTPEDFLIEVSDLVGDL